ncbi:MAG: OsmC family protein [Sideroxydans sp.]
MKVRVKWIERMAFIGESESGHAVVMDASPEVGGRNLGPRPMEMLLLGAGGCSSIDVLSILTKMRQAATDCYVELEATRAETDPKVFTAIHMHFVVKGKDIKPDAVEKAVKLSAEKYCSASIMLGATAAMTHDFEIIEE